MFAMTLTASRLIKNSQLAKAASSFKLENRHKIDFAGTTHRAFRQHVKRMGSLKMKTRGADTFLYDAKGQIIGKMTAASMDSKGKVNPVQYFICMPKTAKTTIQSARSQNSLATA